MTKIATDIHSLADPTAKFGQIRFIHSDGTTHTFQSVVNKMTGDRMSYFDTNPPSVNDSLAWVRSVFTDIRRKCTVLECIGSF